MAANNNVSFDDDQTEELDWLTSEFYGLIIGKGGSTVSKIKALSGADVFINTKGSGKSFLKGDQEQRETARRMISETIAESKSYKKCRGDFGGGSHGNYDNSFGKGWLELDFVSEDDISMVIGKNGETIKRVQNKLNVNLKVKDQKLFIQGDPKTDPEIKEAIVELDQFVWTMKERRVANQNCRKFLYIAGNPESISTVQSPHVPTLSCLRNPPSLVNENETTQQQVADHLLKAFQITKTKQNEMVRTGTGELPSPVASYLVHAGRLFSRLQPGKYPSQSQRFQSSLVYQRLTPADLDIVKMAKMPKINEYSRYDLTIITHLDEQIRYKIFLARKGEGGEGELCFITNEEAGVNENEFRSIREGPGYFSTSYEKTAAIDLVDPENGMTTRVDTFIYGDSQSEEETLKHHLKSLAPFFNGITIRQYDSNFNEGSRDQRDQEISIPEIEDLPPRFRLNYFRRVTRAEYHFAEQNILRTSKETVFVQDDKSFNSTQSDVVDLFFENKAVDDVLKGKDWQPTKVVDEMKKLLQFSKKKMLAYCSK